MNIKNKKIIFVGSLRKYSRSKQRYKSLKDIGLKVTGISRELNGKLPGISKNPSIKERIFNKLGYPLDITNVNKKLLEEVSNNKPDTIWDEKALALKPNTLKNIKKINPNIKLIFYSEDDMYAKHNQSKYFLKSLPLFDIVFTTKSYNVEELKSIGAKNVIFVDKSYDKNTHYPVEINNEDKDRFGAEVGFIGTYEKNRADQILFLAKNDIKVRVFGNGWDKRVNKHKNMKVENIPIYGKDYVKAICATKINLCFLRKLNRDLQTGRTMEIPACGGFMLAERTDEHKRLFEEGKEAEFFDSKEELLEKIKYYLSHDKEREKIAKAGRERCIKSGYSHHDRLKYMMKKINELE